MNAAQAPTARQSLLELTPDALAASLAELGEPAYRAKQILSWIYEHGATTFEQMTNLSKLLREKLAARYVLYTSTIVRRAASTDGTVKLLLQWPDGATSECVMIPAGEHRTACISSQVGCPVGCTFCASGLGGLQRNLTAGEIIEQALCARAEAQSSPPLTREGRGGVHSRKDLQQPAARLSNIVFMGLGEPLANYNSVMHAIRTINAPWGLNIGARKITVSTVGLPRQIRKLADEGLQVNLALSLHAPNDALRRELIPWAERITTRELIDACRYYFEKTGREITLEYILLHGTNDRSDHAAELARFAKQLRCNVNLLRYNPVESLPFARPTSEQAFRFQDLLRKNGVNAHIRKSRGLDIDAACGQLRRRQQQEQSSGVALTIGGE